MLSSEQIEDLAGALAATAETLGQTLSASACELMAEDLAEYPAEATAAALRSCRRELAGKLTLAAIVDRIHANDGRPTANEAWAIALAGTDEFDTVVMTEEIGHAMAAAQPVMETGDKVGARMAFLSAYERLVTAARKDKRPANWSVSLGFDQARRVQAIEQAQRLGRLTDESAQRELARIDAPMTQDGQAIAGLLTGKAVQPSKKLQSKWRALGARLKRDAEIRQGKREEAARLEQERFEAAKADAVAKVKALGGDA